MIYITDASIAKRAKRTSDSETVLQLLDLPDDLPLADYTTDSEADDFWDGVTHGIRSAGGVSFENEARELLQIGKMNPANLHFGRPARFTWRLEVPS